jgi:hypothetical protein
MGQPIILEGEMLYKKIQTLKQLKVDHEHWTVYYADEVNGDKWIKEYPNSELHGGGPPQLRLIEKFPWETTK